MQRLHLVLALSALLSGCASGPDAVPFCSAGDPPLPLAAPACSASAEAQSFEDKLRALVEPAAGPVLVRVGLDADARIAGTCAVRSVGDGQWRARARVGEQLAQVSETLRAPACLAGTRIDLNQTGFAFAHVDEAVRKCEREAESLVRRNPGFSLESIKRGYLQCVASAQLQRNELWIFVPFYNGWRIFVPGEAPQPRRTARLACGMPELASGQGRTPSTGVATPGSDEKLVSCLRGRGWRAFP